MLYRATETPQWWSNLYHWWTYKKTRISCYQRLKYMLLIAGTAKCDSTSHQRKGGNAVEYRKKLPPVAVLQSPVWDKFSRKWKMSFYQGTIRLTYVQGLDPVAVVVRWADCPLVIGKIGLEWKSRGNENDIHVSCCAFLVLQCTCKHDRRSRTLSYDLICTFFYYINGLIG